MEAEDDANADTSSIKQRELSHVFVIYYSGKEGMFLLPFFCWFVCLLPRSL